MFNILDLLNPIQWITFLFSIIGMGIIIARLFFDKRERFISTLWLGFFFNLFLKMLFGMYYRLPPTGILTLNEMYFVNNYTYGIFIYLCLVVIGESIYKIIKTKSCKIWERRKNGL